MCRIIVVGSQKGGVGKSTTVRNLSYSLAELGHHVLAVDFDTQYNLTTCFGISDITAITINIASIMRAMLNDEELPLP